MPSLVGRSLRAACLLPALAMAQQGESSAAAVPLRTIETTVAAKTPIEGADILVLPSAATRRALGWPDTDDAPVTLHGLATGAIFPNGPPAWIAAGVAPAFAILARTDAKGHFHVDVPCIEGSLSGQAWDTHPRLIARAAGCETQDLRWWDGMRSPIYMQQEQVVRGRVADEDGTPVSGALVAAQILGQSQGSPVELARLLPVGLLPAVTTTDVEGRFELRGVRTWNNGLHVAHPDFAPGSVTFTPQPSAPATAVEAGTITLQRGVEIAGRVVDASGAPLACAVVWTNPKRTRAYGYCPDVAWQPDFDDDRNRLAMRGKADTIAVRADDHGRFRLRGITAIVEQGSEDRRELVDIQATAPGYDVGLALDIDLAGDARLDTTIRLHRERVLELHVLDDASGEPIQDASVTGTVLMWPGGWDSGSASPERTGPGAFSLHHAGRHETLLWMTAPEHAPVALRVPGPAAGETRVLDVRLPAHCVLSGRVTSKEGAPLQRAAVSVLTGADRPYSDASIRWGAWRTETDADGRWHVEGLTSRIQYVSIGLDGYSPSLHEDLTLQPGEERSLDVVLSREATLTALWPAEWKLTYSDRRWVRMFNDPPVERSHFSGEPSINRSVIRHLAPGRYTLVADGCEPIAIELSAGEAREVQLTARQPPIVRGWVQSAGAPVAGVPVTGHRVETVPDGRSPYAQSTWTDATGRFELALPYAATWRVQAARRYSHWTSQPIALGWGESTETTIEIPDTRWTLAVVDSLGNPIRNATLRLTDDPWPVHFPITTDDTGVATIEGLPPGRHALVLSDPPVAARAPTTIDLPAEHLSESPALRLVLPRLGAISGRVEGEENRAPRFRVRVIRLEDPLHGEPFRDSYSDLVVKVISGHYDVAGMEPGRFRVLLESQTGPVAMSASAMGIPPRIWWPHASRDITLAPDEQVTLDFDP